MSFLKSIIKSVFKRKENIKAKSYTYNDSLENFITEKEIRCYEYSDFKEVKEVRQAFVRAKFEDEFFTLKSFVNDDETIRKVIIEIELLHNISHKNILKFYGVSRIEAGIIQMNKYILVMEYTDSGTLSTYLNEHSNELNWNDKINLAFQLASTVSYLHDKSIIHKNLRADNILVHQKSIKLAGFYSESSSSLNTLYLFSIIPYIDPKSFIDANYDLNEHSDVYGIGVLLWQISSGLRPFHTKEYNMNLALAIMSGQREETVVGTPLGYSRLYKECWNLEPDERPDMKRVVSVLNQLLSVENLSISNFKKEKKDDDDATKWIENVKEKKDDDDATKWIENVKEKKDDDDATKWIENVKESKKVDFIPFNDLKDPEPLGNGGFGYIKKAIWTRTGKYVVYKRLINTDAIKYNKLDAFIHELKIHLHLSNYSDRIVRCLGISQDDKTREYLLVTQYADGGDLRSYLKNNFKYLTWYDKKKLAYQIADGLNYLHSENVLHRDLHSKNIVVHENNAKIIDFGISKIQDQKSEEHMRDRGIIAYVEPKRILNLDFPYTKSSDVYSFGVLMWEISSGRPPFKDYYFTGGDIEVLALNINNGKREKTISGTPKEYEELYKNCWDQEPSQRPIMSKILDRFAKMGFGVNSDKKNKLMEGSMDDDDDDDDDDGDLDDDLYVKS